MSAMNRFKKFIDIKSDPQTLNQIQIVNVGSIILLFFSIFVVIESVILGSQLQQQVPVERKIKEFEKSINTLSSKNQKIELQKEVINLEIAKVNLLNKAFESRFQLFGALFFVITAYLSWKTVTISKEKQITEILSKAIEQIGNTESLDVRLGGIYTLERIARDSNKYFWTAMEILMDYIKIRTSSVESGSELNSNSSTLLKESLPQDVQAALKIIARRIVSQDPDGSVINLSLCSFKQICLKDARFNRANLSETSFERSDLENSKFLFANLSSTNFFKANLSNSNFRNADLFNSDFSGANLKGADFKKAKFNKTNLEGADLSNAMLKGTDLSNAVGLTQAQIDLALTDLRTILPNYLLAKGEEKIR
jgi:Pentapeptide repeats (8 copies)/Pentapeptide repeats (9 copies)